MHADIRHDDFDFTTSISRDQLKDWYAEKNFDPILISQRTYLLNTE